MSPSCSGRTKILMALIKAGFSRYPCAHAPRDCRNATLQHVVGMILPSPRAIDWRRASHSACQAGTRLTIMALIAPIRCIVSPKVVGEWVELSGRRRSPQRSKEPNTSTGYSQALPPNRITSCGMSPGPEAGPYTSSRPLLR